MQIIRFICVVLAVFSFVGCEFYGGDSMPPADYSVYLRLVSPSGNNILDSLGIYKDGPISIDEKGLFCVDAIRTSDNKPPLRITKNLICASIQAGTEYSKEESIIGLFWSDFDAHEGKETYEIQLQSPKIFGDNRVRNISWFVRVSSRNLVDVYKCIIDGQEVSLDNKIMTHRGEESVITLCCYNSSLQDDSRPK